MKCCDSGLSGGNEKIRCDKHVSNICWMHTILIYIFNFIVSRSLHCFEVLTISVTSLQVPKWTGRRWWMEVLWPFHVQQLWILGVENVCSVWRYSKQALPWHLPSLSEFQRKYYRFFLSGGSRFSLQVSFLVVFQIGSLLQYCWGAYWGNFPIVHSCGFIFKSSNSSE